MDETKHSLRSVKKIIALLNNPEFCFDSLHIIDEVQKRIGFPPNEKTYDLNSIEEQFVKPYITKWGVRPPPYSELLKTDHSRNPAFAILTGTWGMIPVFPWTTKKEIEQKTRLIHKSISKSHKDAEAKRKSFIADWLYMNGVPRNLIAQVVWGRKKGLTRPTKDETINNISMKEEAKLMRQFKEQGLSNPEAERKLYQSIRGTETPASAMVRMAQKRANQLEDKTFANLKLPEETDPLGYAITGILREIFLSETPDLKLIHQLGATLRDILTSSNEHKK